MASYLNGVGGFSGLSFFDTNIPGNVLTQTVINPYSVMTIPAYWRAINFKTDNLTSFPRSVRQEGQLLEVPHRLDKLIKRQPNPYQNATQFWRTLFFHFGHYGNGYAKIKRAANTNVIDSFHNLMPENIVPFRIDDRQYYFNYLGRDGVDDITPAEDMIHLSAISYDGMMGFNPVWVMRETFQRAMFLDRYQTRFLMKGSVVRGSIEIPLGVTDEQIDKIVQTIRTYYSGADADRDLLTLSGGATLKNAGMTPKDSELSWQATYTTKQISQITGVPPQFLYDSSEAKYVNTTEQAGQDVVRYTFRPLIEQIEDELTSKLLSEAEQIEGLRIHLDPCALLRGDSKTLSDIAIAEKAAGIISGNEARADLGKPKSSDPSADKLAVLGDTTVNQANPPSQSAADAPRTTETPARVQSAADPSASLAFAAMLPLVLDACGRVDGKSDKAFGNREGLPDAERLEWANRFSAEQKRYAVETLTPVAVALQLAAGKALNVDDVAGRYADQLMHRAMKEPHQTLRQLVEGTINE